MVTSRDLKKEGKRDFYFISINEYIP